MILQTWSGDLSDFLNYPNHWNVFTQESDLPVSFEALWPRNQSLGEEISSQRDSDADYFLVQEDLAPPTESPRSTDSRLALALLKSLKSASPTLPAVGTFTWVAHDGHRTSIWLLDARATLKAYQ